jgi:ABC-type phosphate transport system substrate-binding protein
MRSSIALATFMALTAGTVGAGALDAVPSMVGSDTLKNLTVAVLNNCTALHTLGDPIKYDGTGSGAGENALKIIGASSTQLIAPMSRAMGSAVCTGPTAAQRAGAEGLVVALDGLAIIGNQDNVGAEGIDYPGTAGNTSNQWRSVLRLIYTGMDISAGNNVFLRDCNSQARKDIVNNWDNVFHGTVTSCTDSHPSVPGSGAAGYDQSNAIVEPGVRHAFRRDDESGTTDVFLGQLSLSGVNFAQGAPSGSNTVQTAVYRALAGSPFCNNKRPEDKWAPVTLAANSTLGFNASQIPEMTNVGVPTGAGTGLGFSTQLKGSANAKNMAPYLTEYTDQDPIRRKCVGRGNNANAALPFEQVCSADGTLGVVLPITVPAELTTAERYPTLPCEPGKGFFLAPALQRPTTDPLRCPNGDATQDGQCLLPVRTDATQPNGVAFDCINPPGNVPQAVFDSDGDGSQFPDAPGTDGRTDIDGRVYNLVLRKPSGEIRTVLRNDPSKVGTFQTPVAAAYYRIHTTRSLLLPPNHTAKTCAVNDDATDQIGCLALASPCSIGYAGRGGVTTNPGTVAALVNGVAPTDTNIRALVLGTTPVYPIARKLYLNTLQGFDILHDSSATVPGTDAEEEMAKCYATLPFNGTINLQSPAIGFVNLPPATGSSTPKPLCEDFNGSTVCSDASNTDACIGNDAFAGGVIPSSICDNGLRDGAETATDVCQAGTTCNSTTHHCQ